TDSDGNSASDPVEVTVTDETETVSLTLSDTENSGVAENVAYSASAPTFTVGTPVGIVTYSLTGADAADFTVAADGAVSMVARDFESPVDADGNNVYEYTLVATDSDGNSASDPVEVTVTDDNAGFTLSAEMLEVTEGSTGTFTARLNAKPTSNNVVLTVASSSDGVATVDKSELTFTTDNWDTAQTVTVTGVDNDTPGNGTAAITLAVNDAQSDASFHDVTDETVMVTVADDDNAGFRLSAEMLEVTEGSTGTFTARLNAQPSGDVKLNVSSDSETVATVSPATLLFTTERWDTEQTITVTAVDDYSLSDTDTIATIKVSIDEDNSDAQYHGLEDQSVSITITDDETAVSLIEDFNKGDGSTPPPPGLAIYKAAEIENISDDNLILVNSEVLIQEDGGADTKAKIQALVDKVNDRLSNPDEVVFNPSTIAVKQDDEGAKKAVEEYALSLGVISINKTANTAYKVYDRIDDNVSVGSGREDMGDQNGLVDVDGKPGLEVYIEISGPDSGVANTGQGKPLNTKNLFLWNPTDNTFESVNLHFTDLPGGSHKVGDVVGYPMGMEGKAMAVSSRPSISIVAEKADHSLHVYGFSDGKLVPVTKQLTSATTADDNGQYPLTVTPSDYVQPLDIGDNMLILKGSTSLLLPITVVKPSLKLTMAVNRKQVTAGSTVTYSLQAENESSFAANRVAINNTLPLGFNYIKGSAYWDHDGNSETPMQKVETTQLRDGKLQFNLGDIDTGAKHTLRYQLRVGNGVNKGAYSNSAIIVDNNGTPNSAADDTALSVAKSVDVRVVEDALFELSTVIGKVFNDINGNGMQDLGDKPIPYARLITSSGQQIRVDGNGQYHLASMRPGRMVMRLDQRSLPDGATVIGNASKVVDVRSGIPAKVNFAVQLPHGGDTTSPIKIEQLSKMPKPRLNIAVFGTAHLSDDQKAFAAPLEIRAYSNYPAFISQWQVLIAENFSRRVLKTFSGTASDFYQPLYWDGITDDAGVVDPALNYTVQLVVTDSDGRRAYTHPRPVNVAQLRDEFDPFSADRKGAVSTPQDTESKARLNNSDHSRWLQRLVEEDSTERSNIRLMGKSVRVSGERYSAVRIASEDPVHERIEIPSYSSSSQASSLIHMMRGVSMHNDSSDELAMELIMPRKKVNIQVLGHASVRDTNSQQAQQPAITTAVVKPYPVQTALGQQPIEPEQDLPIENQARDSVEVPIQTVTHSQATPQVIFDQQVDLNAIAPTNDYFLVGIVDAEIAYRDLSGNVDLAKSGDAVYADKIWKDGKIQLHYQGTVAGEYLITASVDTERDSHDLYSNLDPDASYAIYGDSSSVNNLAAESDGALYLLVEKDASWAKWGRLQAALDNNQIVSFKRSVQGGQVHYESLESTAYGQPRTEADAFVATAYQKSAHIEFHSTGSSLYYLKHQGALRDSLRLRVEVRDRFSGNVKTSRPLTLGDDYQFDSAAGRISFWEPPEREVESELLIGGERGAVDDIYLVADYSYSIAGEWSEGVSGGQIQQALGDRVVLGVTQVDEQQQGGSYNLEGVNSTLHLSENHRLRLEYARSESRAEPKYLSTDGGLSWGINESQITAADSNLTGDASSLQGDATFLDGRIDLSYYARDIAEGFSSGGSHHQRGQRAAGLDISHRVNQDLSLRFKHDRNSQLGDGDAQSNRRSGALDSNTSSLHASYKMGDKFTLSGELRHQASSVADSANRGADNDDGSALALQGRYRFDADTELSLTQQASIGGDADNQTRIGLRKRINQRLSLQGRLSHDNSGVAYGLDTAYNLHDKLSINTGLEQDSQGTTTAQLGTGYSPSEDSKYNLTLQQRRSDKSTSSQSLNVGSSHQLSDSTTLGTGASFALSGENRRQSTDANISHRLADGRELRGAVSRYTQQEDDQQHSDGHEINLGADIDGNWSAFITLGQGDIHRIDGGLDKRKNFAFGAGYIRTDEDQQQQLKGRLRYEQRSDRGQQNTDTQRLNLDVKGRLNQDITLLSALNWGQSKDRDSDAVQARNNRFDLSAAYRPVETDRLNIIGKYSWVEDRQPEGQAGDIGFAWQKGHVLATDVLFDLNAKWRIGGKLAARHGEQKMFDMPWNDTRRWLLATRVGYRLQQDTLLNIEYRLLKDQTADDQRDGTVIELVRRFNNKIEVGIGINYAGFSDDLGLNDYTEQRGYLRITGVLE
ncbi:MAG: hypothetical protein ACPG3V_07225, partial [Porticoccaceae bacterium]